MATPTILFVHDIHDGHNSGLRILITQDLDSILENDINPLITLFVQIIGLYIFRMKTQSYFDYDDCSPCASGILVTRVVNEQRFHL